MGLSRELIVLVSSACLTLALYGSRLSDGFVYQDANYAYTVSPTVVHGVSLALHLLNGLLLYTLLRPQYRWASVMVALFWIHPLNVETVAYGAAQSELIILGGLLLIAVSLQYRLWAALLLPVLALTTTKLKAIPQFLLSQESAEVVAHGVSFMQWWQWEATAAWRLFWLWISPIGLSVDHDTVHVAAWLQIVALVSLPIVLMWIAWQWPRARWPVAVIVGLLIPRFAIRVPLSILNEHHFYPVTAALSVLTVTAWRGVHGHRE
jgi:hypothetical protein